MHTYSKLLLIIQSGLRAIDADEVLKVLSDGESKLPRDIIEVDMQPFKIEGGVWDDSEGYILEKAREIHHLADKKGGVDILYFGIPEIPHVIALGAYMSDKRFVRTFDHNRSKGTWKWEKNAKPLPIQIEGLPKEKITQQGEAVIRVEISATIDDEGVEAMAGRDNLADIRIRLSPDQVPSIGSIVRSESHVDEIREKFREAFAALLHYRPHVSLIHLFVAAPAPVCFVIGQELQLRNSVQVQTYRFRNETGQRKAILLTAEEARSVTQEYSDEDLAAAGRTRSEVFPKVLKQVQQYADNKKEGLKDGSRKWYELLRYHENLPQNQPFPALSPVYAVVEEKDTVDPKPKPGNEYANLRNVWQLSDPLLIGLEKACGSDEELEELIRLFLFHEYIHQHHSLTKFNVEGVGRFENCLEKLDYMADLYALLHQLDYAFMTSKDRVKNKERKFLEEQIDLVLRSTWAFIPGEKVPRFQVRAVRRLLNWYWRHIQVSKCESLEVALRILAQPPTIELVGPQVTVGGGRIYMSMEDVDSSVELSIGIVLENARFFRKEDSVNTNLEKLMEAFLNRDHEQIKLFFEGLFEAAKQMGGAVPSPGI